MIKFSTIGQIEKIYVFQDAIIETPMYNGTFGDVAEGKFTASENKAKAIMQVEVGDDEYTDDYMIPAGSHVRVVDLEALSEKYPNIAVQVFGRQVPTDVKVGESVHSDANGNLIKNDGTKKFKVTKVLGNHAGIEIELESGE